MAARREQGGFSLVELLVAIGIVGILLGLLLPAVQGIRETQRRMQCAARLQQIGIALHSHASHKVTFPAAAQHPSMLSWMVSILPYVEQKDLYQQFDFSLYYAEGSNAPLTNTRVALYQCPSMPTPPNFVANYSGCGGSAGWNHSGIFPVGRFAGCSPADVRDGLSNTVAVSETASSGPLGLVRFNRRTEPFEEALRVCRESAPAAAGFSIGTTWTLGAWGATVYHHAMPPNRPSCSNGTATGRMSILSAASFHPGGVHALFADGRVELVQDSIDLAVWRALATRSEGDVAL